jgi:hypothetical protein
MATIVSPSPPSRAGAWDYFRTQDEVSRILRRMGAPAVLRRGIGAGAADRWCIAFLYRWKPTIQMGGLVDPMERLALISAHGLTIPPDNNLDALVTFLQPIGDVAVQDENLRIVAPPARIEPAGVLLAYKLRVRR